MNSARSAQSGDERFDVVDAEDRVIGVAERGEVHRRGLRHRAVHIFWGRADGCICLQRRSFAKDSSPGLLSSSCAGHVDSGETYLQAAVREFEEELGVALRPDDFREVDYAPCHEELGNEFVRTYVVRGGWRPVPNGSEVDSLVWRSPSELVTWASSDPALFASPLHHLLTRDAVLAAVRALGGCHGA